jgi:hypothetical protein
MMANMVLKAENLNTIVVKDTLGYYSDGDFTIFHAKDINGYLQGYDGY